MSSTPDNQFRNGSRYKQIAEQATSAWKDDHPKVEDKTVALKEKTLMLQIAEAFGQYADYRDWYGRRIVLSMPAETATTHHDRPAAHYTRRRARADRKTVLAGALPRQGDGEPEARKNGSWAAPRAK